MTAALILIRRFRNDYIRSHQQHFQTLWCNIKYEPSDGSMCLHSAEQVAVLSEAPILPFFSFLTLHTKDSARPAAARSALRLSQIPGNSRPAVDPASDSISQLLMRLLVNKQRVSCLISELCLSPKMDFAVCSV